MDNNKETAGMDLDEAGEAAAAQAAAAAAAAAAGKGQGADPAPILAQFGLPPHPGPPAVLALEVVAQAGEDEQQANRAQAEHPVPGAGAVGFAALGAEAVAAAAPANPFAAAAAVPVLPPAPAPRNHPNLLLRRASVSSLDECSQRGQDSSGGAGGASGAGPFSPSPSSGPSSRPFGHLRTAPSYRNPAHPQRSLEGLRRLRCANQFTDVTLCAGAMEVPAHKNVLAAASPYFHAMFTGFDESRRDRVELGGIDPDALVALVDYIYSSEVDVTEDNVQSLLTAANLLQLDDVRDGCCDFLQSQLHPTNCLGIKTFADVHGLRELHSQAVAFIETRFTEVLDCDEFLQLEVDQVEELVGSDTISVPSEERVYESVVSWVGADPEGRRRHLARLMARVRLPLLSRDYLMQRVDSEGLFESEPRCKDFIIEALKYHLAQGDPARLVAFRDSERIRPRMPVGLPKVMLAIGGQVLFKLFLKCVHVLLCVFLYHRRPRRSPPLSATISRRSVGSRPRT